MLQYPKDVKIILKAITFFLVLWVNSVNAVKVIDGPLSEGIVKPTQVSLDEKLHIDHNLIHQHVQFNSSGSSADKSEVGSGFLTVIIVLTCVIGGLCVLMCFVSLFCKTTPPNHHEDLRPHPTHDRHVPYAHHHPIPHVYEEAADNRL
mmetsp:Transcript_95522/g.187534  ORF Transcript_95522/g.187534 Transcript_95522/m.187534 type:complete len:148 (-) Transcript_95522:167-610(-)